MPLSFVFKFVVAVWNEWKNRQKEAGFDLGNCMMNDAGTFFCCWNNQCHFISRSEMSKEQKIKLLLSWWIWIMANSFSKNIVLNFDSFKKKNRKIAELFLNGPIPASFCFLSSFSHYNSKFKLKNWSWYIVHGIRTRDHSIVAKTNPLSCDRHPAALFLE